MNHMSSSDKLNEMLEQAARIDKRRAFEIKLKQDLHAGQFPYVDVGAVSPCFDSAELQVFCDQLAKKLEADGIKLNKEYEGYLPVGYAGQASEQVVRLADIQMLYPVPVLVSYTDGRAEQRVMYVDARSILDPLHYPYNNTPHVLLDEVEQFRFSDHSYGVWDGGNEDPNWKKACSLLGVEGDQQQVLGAVLDAIFVKSKYRATDLIGGVALARQMVIRIVQTPLGRRLLQIITNNVEMKDDFPVEVYQLDGFLRQLSLNGITDLVDKRLTSIMQSMGEEDDDECDDLETPTLQFPYFS